MKRITRSVLTAAGSFISGAMLSALTALLTNVSGFPLMFNALFWLVLMAFSVYAGWTAIDLIDHSSVTTKRVSQLAFVLGLFVPLMAIVWVVAQAA